MCEVLQSELHICGIPTILFLIPHNELACTGKVMYAHLEMVKGNTVLNAIYKTSGITYDLLINITPVAVLI